MRQVQRIIRVHSHGKALTEITGKLETVVGDSGIEQGLATVFCRHTSCSLLIQENADPDVRRDLEEFFRRLVPEGMDWIVHRTEGPDDMPAHIRTALTQTSIGIPLNDGRPMLGTWQGLYLFEHRARSHDREVVVQLIGEP